MANVLIAIHQGVAKAHHILKEGACLQGVYKATSLMSNTWKVVNIAFG